MLDVVVLFFLLGVGARLVGSDLKLPEALYETLMRSCLTPPQRLLGAGWTPVHATTRAGMREWARR